VFTPLGLKVRLQNKSVCTKKFQFFGEPTVPILEPMLASILHLYEQIEKFGLKTNLIAYCLLDSNPML